MVLTILFVATGIYCLWRWVSGLTVRRSDRDVLQSVADLNHVVMSVAMVVMMWWPAGVLGTAVQGAVFVLLGTVFLRRLVRAESAVALFGAVAHTSMNAAMVWMLAMPVFVRTGPAQQAAVGSGAHHHHGLPGGDSGVDAALADLLPAWAHGVTWVAVVLVGLGALWWLIRAVRVPGHRLYCGCHAVMGIGMTIMLVGMNGAG